MKILYASNICSEKEFKRIYDMCSTTKPLQSIQKFNKLLCNGLAKQKDVQLDVITSAPVNRKMCKKIFWRQKKEKENNIEYHYCFMLNFPIIKFICLFFSSIFSSLYWCVQNRKSKESFIIYDAYCPIIANVTAIIANMFHIKVIALYTDLPQYMNSNLKCKNKIKFLLKKWYQSFNNLSNKIASEYILLTEPMNEIVNPQNKPYIIVEGLADIEVPVENKLENKYEDFTIMYAGGLYEKFGIYNLVKAVENIKNDNIRLNLYGNGEMEDFLNTNYKNNKKVNYFGVLDNKKIVEEEVKSTILINPRFTNEEYTKYSFPSKNMEYMTSGTPVLTTKLPGMPEEYYNYVYLIENETVDGIKNAIEKTLNIDSKELHKKGQEARRFVLNEKNNIIQAKRIIEFIKKYIN